MSLRIDFDGPWNPQIQAQIESALQTCIGVPGDGEEWTVLVELLGEFCAAQVKTVRQTRKKLFLVPASKLAEAIPEWLRQYPLRWVAG